MLDQKDIKIIEILSKDSRTPFTEIARRLGVSESTIRKRVEALENRGVIKKYSIVVDPAKMGYKTVALVGLDVQPDKFLEAAEELSKLEEVKLVATSTGDHMIMTEIWTKDGRELGLLISKKLGKIPGIHRICPAIILEKIKEE
jgi:Lrp/AsnC family transcriptional regulator for asnA, asnC and gidA